MNREQEKNRAAIDAAKLKVKAARIAYSKGTGTVAQCNKAERELADADQDDWRWDAGLSRDDR
jgi:outer membrane protein TolC